MQRMQRAHDSEIGAARSRIAQLEGELDAAKAQIRDLRQRVFGSKTEHSRWVHVESDGGPAAPARPRGQQRGAAGHGRRRLESLPAREEHRVLGT